MSDKTFSKLIFPALLTTGAVFTALAAPVVMFGSEKLMIQQGGSTPFTGTVREAALPYLGLAGFASVGLGLSGVAVGGWRKTAKRANQLDGQVAQMQQQMVEKDQYLRHALMSDAYLERSGLDFFLADEAALPTPEVVPAAFMPEFLPPPQRPLLPERQLEIRLQEQQATMQAQERRNEQHLPAPRGVAAPAPSPHLPEVPVQPVSTAPQSPEVIGYTTSYQVPTPATTVVPATVNVQAAVTPLTAAQGFLSFSRSVTPTTPQPPVPTAPAVSAMNAADDLTIEKIQTLQTQLQQIVAQIEALQTRLVPDEPGAAQTEPTHSGAWRSVNPETAWPVARRAAS
jgi:hypothetical protein